MMQGVAQGGAREGLVWANKQQPVQTKMFSVNSEVPTFQFMKCRSHQSMTDGATDHWMIHESILSLLHAQEEK